VICYGEGLLAFGAVEVFRVHHLELVDDVVTLNGQATLCVQCRAGEEKEGEYLKYQWEGLSKGVIEGRNNSSSRCTSNRTLDSCSTQCLQLGTSILFS